MARKRDRAKKYISSADTSEQGVVGYEYNAFSGGSQIKEDPLRLLQGDNKYKWFLEMILNDPFIGANYKLTTILGSKGNWAVKPTGDTPQELADAEWVKNTLLKNRDFSFEENIKFLIGSLFYAGFAINEVVYKKQDDGTIGIGKLAKRASNTIKEWVLDDKQNITGVIQEDPNNYNKITIPYSKLLHYKIDFINGSPEGMSLLRNCFTSYYAKKEIAILELIRIGKDSRGVNVATCPTPYLMKGNKAGEAYVNNMRTGLANIANGKDAFILISGDKGFGFETKPMSGQITQDTNIVIERSNRDISISLLSDFVLLGHKSASSGNIAQAKVNIYSNFVSSLMDVPKEQINKVLIPNLFEKNGWKRDSFPSIEHDSLQSLKTLEFALLLQAGIITQSVERQNFLGKMYGGPNFPDVSQEDMDKADTKPNTVNNNTDNKTGGTN